MQRISSVLDDLLILAASSGKTVDWDYISQAHPGLYGSEYEPEEGEEEDDDPYNHGSAANELAHARSEDPEAEGSSVYDLEFHPQRVDPKHIDYNPHPDKLRDGRVNQAYEGYKKNPDSVPPLLLVHRHGVYQVADGHHRAQAAALAGVKPRAYVAYSPHEKEPFPDEEHPFAPFYGATSDTP
jgi:hypothetical protein